MDAHVFVDNSNAFGGAQRAAGTQEPEAVWMAVRLYFKNFAALIESGYEVKTRVLTGSIPPGNEDLWGYTRNAGYDTDLLHRIEQDDGRLVEQGVDKLAHLKIANALLDYDPPQTLVLVTGDGNEGDYKTSFTKQIKRALRRKWRVVVWSWKEQLSGKFQRIRVPAGLSLEVRELDPYYKAITYVRAGTYDLKGVSVSCGDRIVSKLRI